MRGGIRRQRIRAGQLNHAADDFETIARTMAHEAGFRVGVECGERTCPGHVKAVAAWYASYDKRKRLAPAAE